jgi:hypothetical protein
MLYPRQQRPRLTSHGTIDTALAMLLLLLLVFGLPGLLVLLLIATRCSSLRMPCPRPPLRTSILMTAAAELLLLLPLLQLALLLPLVLLLAQAACKMRELACRTVSKQLTPLAMLNSL